VYQPKSQAGLAFWRTTVTRQTVIGASFLTALKSVDRGFLGLREKREAFSQ